MIKVSSLDDLTDDFLSQFSVVCLDESQFFKNLRSNTIRIVEKLGLDLYAAGLSGDYNRRCFGEFYEIFPLGKNFIHLKDTLCSGCAAKGIRSTALHTHRLEMRGEIDNVVEVGSEQYTPLCRLCYVLANSTP
jgi:thymidine kinase